MERYRCVSRKFPGQVCEHHYEVKLNFWPKGCLQIALYQNWEKVEKKP